MILYEVLTGIHDVVRVLTSLTFHQVLVVLRLFVCLTDDYFTFIYSSLVNR